MREAGSAPVAGQVGAVSCECGIPGGSTLHMTQYSIADSTLWGARGLRVLGLLRLSLVPSCCFCSWTADSFLQFPLYCSVHRGTKRVCKVSYPSIHQHSTIHTVMYCYCA